MPIAEQSYRFTHAICRQPARSVVHGLQAGDTGAPDFDLFSEHHGNYVQALEQAGVTVTVTPPLEDFPDSVFVEDTALCLPEGAIALRPGASSRFGEAAAIAPELNKHMSNVIVLEGDGFIEGGDILVTGSEVLVGLSDRTDQKGFDQLTEIAGEWGYSTRLVQTPPGVLHFKTDCGLLDENTILATRRLAASGCFEGYRVIKIPNGEEPAANSIRVNDTVFMPQGFLKTKTLVEEARFQVITLANSEAAKIDGGLSCMSLRFSPLDNHQT